MYQACTSSSLFAVGTAPGRGAIRGRRPASRRFGNLSGCHGRRPFLDPGEDSGSVLGRLNFQAARRDRHARSAWRWRAEIGTVARATELFARLGAAYLPLVLDVTQHPQSSHSARAVPVEPYGCSAAVQVFAPDEQVWWLPPKSNSNVIASVPAAISPSKWPASENVPVAGAAPTVPVNSPSLETTHRQIWGRLVRSSGPYTLSERAAQLLDVVCVEASDRCAREHLDEDVVVGLRRALVLARRHSRPVQDADDVAGIVNDRRSARALSAEQRVPGIPGVPMLGLRTAAVLLPGANHVVTR